MVRGFHALFGINDINWCPDYLLFQSFRIFATENSSFRMQMFQLSRSSAGVEQHASNGPYLKG